MLENVINKIDARQARLILHQLPVVCREVYMWRVFVGLTYSEIGDIFGISESWAQRIYMKAKTIILNQMKGI